MLESVQFLEGGIKGVRGSLLDSGGRELSQVGHQREGIGAGIAFWLLKKKTSSRYLHAPLSHNILRWRGLEGASVWDLRKRELLKTRRACGAALRRLKISGIGAR